MKTLRGRKIITMSQYLLIGGAPKCGTTSLFNYLADHPQVCPASRKETYFFAREFDYKKVCKFTENLDGYLQYFRHCRGDAQLLIEGTPYTLYSTDSSEKINNVLENSIILFILRDPIRRLYSEFHFHKQINHPAARPTFKEFVENQVHTKTPVPNLLELGCYIYYLRAFFNIFGRDRIKILFFETFFQNITSEILRLCEDIGINPSFYKDYRFQSHNPTREIKYKSINQLYLKMEPVIVDAKAVLMKNPGMYRAFNRIVNKGKSIYRSTNSRESPPEETIPTDILEFLVDYYHSCNLALSMELNLDLPWKLSRI
jgi:hypothetical protein